jgi:hypothetical protein
VNNSISPLFFQSVDINILVNATRNIPGVESVFPIEFKPARVSFMYVCMGIENFTNFEFLIDKMFMNWCCKLI